ncbi:MAG: hypothetical protein P1V81_18125, partial [Planctomycetota bacterium]|nr:hypothetical protein [Planctomycetota bacterium]
MKRLASIALASTLLAASAQAQKVSGPGFEVDSGGFRIGALWGLLDISMGEPGVDGQEPAPKVPEPDDTSPEWKDAEKALEKNQEQIDRALNAGAHDAAEALAHQGTALAQAKRELAAAGGQGGDGGGD